MYQELNLEPWQYMVLFPLLLAIIIFLWHIEGNSEPISEPYRAIDDEVEETPKASYNANYGAYIQAQGRYYN